MAKIKIIFGIVASLIVVCFIAFYLALTNIKTISANLIGKACSSCSGHIGSVEFTKFDFSSPTLNNIRVRFGNPKISSWTITIQSLHFTIDWRQAWRYNFDIAPLQLVGVHVELAESDLAKTHKSAMPKPKKLQSILVQNISVRDGEFTYVDINPGGKQGKLTFKNIEVDIDRVHWRNDKTPPSTINVAARGNFGNAHIKVDMGLETPFKPLNIDIDTHVKNMNLAAINPYSEPIESLQLQGIVETSEAKILLKEDQINAKVSLLYKDLLVKALKSKESSAFVASIASLALNAKLCNSNVNRAGQRMVKTLNITRKDESIVQFILRAHLEAGLSLACFEQPPS